MLGATPTDHLAQLLKPTPGPNEFDSQDRKANRYNDKGGSRCDDHDNSQQQHAATNDGDNHSSARLIGKIECFFDHEVIT